VARGQSDAIDPATDIPLPTGWRRADFTNWLGKPHDAGAFRGAGRCTLKRQIASRPLTVY